MRTLSLVSSLLLLMMGSFLLSACDSSGANDEMLPPEEETFARADLLANVGHNLVVPAYQQLQAATDALEQATDAFAAAPTPQTLAAAQTALKAARLAWQDANLFQFGPAESVALRAALNTFPTNTDQVEANLESGGYVLGSIANRAAGGFPALGYLLHGANSDAELLAAYTSDAHAANRIAYVQANVTFIKENVDRVVQQWDPAGGDYLSTFLSQEKAGTDVGSALGMLLNASILHYERFLRDGKIGIPAGVRSAGVPRPATIEALYAGYSAELAQANMRAIERLYLGMGLDGTDGIGLDENLRALEAGDLANDMTNALSRIRAVLDTLSDPFSTQVEANKNAAISAFTEMQQYVVLAKADMTSILGISITYQDVDGD